MDPAFVEAFLKTIDCYVMGSRTYETALDFEAQGIRLVLWRQAHLRPHQSRAAADQGDGRVLLGDLAQFVNDRLRPAFGSIWFVGGGAVSGECLRLGLADEVRYSILPILIGDGISFFEGMDKDVALHLAEVKAYKSGMVELRYEVPEAGSQGRSKMVFSRRISFAAICLSSIWSSASAQSPSGAASQT